MKTVAFLIVFLVAGAASAEPISHGLEALGLELRVNDATWEELIARPAPEGALPDQLPGIGKSTVRRALLTRPTDRYRHGILGDSLEAGGLLVEWVNGTGAELVLPEDSVFEELTPRVANANKGAGEEVIVVRSYLHAGAALAVVGFDGRALSILAETAAIGTPNRWLNPVGVGDLTGDGHPEIVYVETPHIGGVLKIVRMDEDQLTLLHSEAGFSNHAIGSRNQLLGGVSDLDQDGRAEILVPDQNHRILHILSFDGERLMELARVEHPGRIDSNFSFVDQEDEFHVRYRLADGTVMTLARP